MQRMVLAVCNWWCKKRFELKPTVSAEIRLKAPVEDEESSEQAQRSPIAEGDVDGVAAGDDAEGEGPEGRVSLADDPGA